MAVPNKIIKLVLSDDTFGGFQHYYQINPGTTIDDLINSILVKLRETLSYNNLENARVLLQGKQFHIHGVGMVSILNNANNADNTIYVCSHH